MKPDTEQLMKKLHASLCPDKLEAEIRDKLLALEAEIERFKEDTELLNFLENEHFDNVFPLGKTWYSRLAYGQPYKKHTTLRSAINAAINNKEQK